MGTRTCFGGIALVCGCLSFILLATSLGTNYWKQDIDYYKNIRSSIGLWSACVEATGR